MMKIQDVRYQATGPRTASAQTVLLPLWLWVKRASYQIAVRDARLLAEQLAAELPQFNPKGAALFLGDFGEPQANSVAELLMDQESRELIRLEVEFCVVLTVQQGHFWERAELIAQAIDFLQRFCQKPRDKYTSIQARAAHFPDEPAPQCEPRQGT